MLRKKSSMSLLFFKEQRAFLQKFGLGLIHLGIIFELLFMNVLGFIKIFNI